MNLLTKTHFTLPSKKTKIKNKHTLPNSLKEKDFLNPSLTRAAALKPDACLPWKCQL